MKGEPHVWGDTFQKVQRRYWEMWIEPNEGWHEPDERQKILKEYNIVISFVITLVRLELG
jgi:hypothetical protein